MTPKRSLTSECPKLAKEWHPTKNGVLLPSDVPPHSNKKVWWLCPICNFEWQATVGHRTNGRGCPKCSRKRAAEKLTKKNLVVGVSDLKTLFPDIASHWDYEKNPDMPEDNSPYSLRKKWWICEKGHSYDMSISSRTAGSQGCPYCASKRILVGFNDLASQRPDLVLQWDNEKNEKSPSEVMVKSGYKAYWLCEKGHSYQTAVSERTRTDGKATACPYCAGKKVLPGYNDLVTVRPEIAKQWNYDLNGELKPDQVSEYSMKRVFWICDLGHVWNSTVANRSSGNGCPYCSGKKLLKGFNDLKTLFPYIATEWSADNIKQPEDYTAGSHMKVKWKCSKCGNTWTAQIKERTYGHTGCPKCTHYFKTSAPEQAIFFYVKKCFPGAINSYKDESIGNREIDIYIPSIKLGIEYDGGFWHTNNDRDLEKTKILKENDIDLIRVRESKAIPIDDGSVQIITKESSDDLSELEPAIRQLFEVISKKGSIDLSPDIDIKRDYQDILSLSEGNQYDKSLLASGDIVLQEWNYEKNGVLTPDKFTYKSRKIVWWKCSKCGKEWQQSIKTKVKSGLNCETCNKKRANRERVKDAIQSGRSIPLTDYPLLVEEWYDDEDISLYSRGSDKRARWRCSKCGNVFYQAIKNRTLQGQGCPKCSNAREVDGQISFF